MTAIHANRRSLGVFLLVAGVFAVVHFVMLWPFLVWGYLFMAPVYASLAYLGYILIANPPLVTIGDGCFTVHRSPLAPICIPFTAIRTVRYRKLTETAGEARMIEVSLRHHTLQTEKLRASFWHRQLLKENSWYGGYLPPDEPFVVIQTSMLDISESDFADAIEAAIREAGS